MNPDPDYSAAYVVLRTADGAEGHGFTFTIGRGNEVCRAAIEALAPLVVGQRHRRPRRVRAAGSPTTRRSAGSARRRASCTWPRRRSSTPPGTWRAKARRQAGVAAARRDDARSEIVDLVDWRYLTDALTPDEALRPAQGGRAGPGRAGRPRCERVGYPAYTTSPGWLGYSDAKLDRLAREAVADGYTPDQAQGRRRPRRRHAPVRARPARWSARTSGSRSTPTSAGTSPRRSTWMTALAPYDPWWIEEPTSPDDVLGHAAIRRALADAAPDGGRIRVATGEHVANRVMFKQLLQADAIDFVQLDACRVGRRQRERRDPAAGGQVRHAGLPARRRRRPVRAGAAPVGLRLRGGVRHRSTTAPSSTSTTCTSTSSTRS